MFRNFDILGLHSLIIYEYNDFFIVLLLCIEFSGVQDEVAEKLGFEKVSEEFIGECKSKAVLFRHKKTGAEVMSVSNDDENKVFGIVFRTPP